jgi:hypothetical protein
MRGRARQPDDIAVPLVKVEGSYRFGAQRLCLGEELEEGDRLGQV